MLPLLFLYFDAKKDAWFTIYCSMHLYAVILILNYVADYANCLFRHSMLPTIRKLERLFLHLYIIRADILIPAIFHSKPFWNDAKLMKADSFIQMPGMYIGRHHRIKLQ